MSEEQARELARAIDILVQARAAQEVARFAGDTAAAIKNAEIATEVKQNIVDILSFDPTITDKKETE